MDFILGYETQRRLESFWSANGFAGLVSFATPYGPRFFDMALTSPSGVALELHNETGADYSTIAKWIEAPSADSWL